MKEVQLLMMDEPKEIILERRIEALEKEIANTRRGLFKRYDLLYKMVFEIKGSKDQHPEIFNALQNN